MHKTLQALVTDTEKALYQSAGPGVQVYAQDIIARHINEAFEHIYKQRYWPQFRKRETRTLDGVTGQVTVPFTYIQDWEDIQHVFRRGSDRPLPVLPASYNSLDDPVNHATPRYIEATGDANLFRIYPLAAEGDVLVVGRATQLVEYGLLDEVPFDHLALVHYAAWTYFTDDASNPASAAKHQGLFESRMKVILDNSQNHEIELNPNSAYIPDRWYER